jgi:hypothetical protein
LAEFQANRSLTTETALDVALERDRNLSSSRWPFLLADDGCGKHVNHEKKVLHFIVDRTTDGVASFSEQSGALAEGDAISLKLSKFTSKHGPGYRGHQVKATSEQPTEEVKKTFCAEVRVSNGMGFTHNDIFIAPPLVARHKIEDDTIVSGTALWSFNKKKNRWGWKAISVVND